MAIAASSRILASQYVTVQVTGFTGGTAPYAVTVTGVDAAHSHTFSKTQAAVAAGSTVYLKVGPWRRGATVAFTVTVTQAGPVPAFGATSFNLTIANTNSPGVIVRQLVHDILSTASLGSGVVVLEDEWHRAVMAYADIPFAGGSRVVEVGAPKTELSKRTGVRSEGRVEIPVTVLVLDASTTDGVLVADNLCWTIQQTVNAVHNLNAGSLGINDYTWSWSVDAPEVADVQGSHVPVVSQEMRLSVPVIWVTK